MESTNSIDQINDEDDPVVEEYDVILNDKWQDIRLFSYPLRPAYIPYEFERIKEFRMKPFQHIVEMEFYHNTQAGCFDSRLFHFFNTFDVFSF